MRRILTLLILAAACLGARGQHPAPEEYIYPIRDVEGLYSANFGEMRPAHFHAGIDIKTDGAEGKPLVAVADGYVSRVSLGAYGYGRAKSPSARGAKATSSSRPATAATA